MKKVAIILTCLALAGCTKDVKIASGGDVPVGFSPLTDAATKAVYLGEQNATYTGKGSTYETFKAYARFTDAPGTNPKTGGVEFFPSSGVNCVHGGTGANDYWAPDPTYYWPKNGYLTFHAFSPADLSPFSGTITHDWNTGITITNFKAGDWHDNYRNRLVDILYSDFEFKKQRSDYTPESGVPYDEASEAAGYNHKGVNLRFHHALAAAQFRFKTDADYSAGRVKYTFKTKRLDLLYLNYKGEFHENRVSGANNNYGNAPAGAITFNDDNALTATPYWIPAADEYAKDIKVSGQETTLTATAKQVGSTMLVMPQNLAHAGTGHTVSFKITYSFSYQVEGEAVKTYDNLVCVIPLAGLKISGTSTPINQWLINHKYTYTINFHLDPLLFEPYLSADWVEVSPVGISLPYVE